MTKAIHSVFVFVSVTLAPLMCENEMPAVLVVPKTAVCSDKMRDGGRSLLSDPKVLGPPLLLNTTPVLFKLWGQDVTWLQKITNKMILFFDLKKWIQFNFNVFP